MQQGLISSSIANGLPPPESQLHTHTAGDSAATGQLGEGTARDRRPTGTATGAAAAEATGEATADTDHRRRRNGTRRFLR